MIHEILTGTIILRFAHTGVCFFSQPHSVSIGIGEKTLRDKKLMSVLLHHTTNLYKITIFSMPLTSENIVYHT